MAASLEVCRSFHGYSVEPIIAGLFFWIILFARRSFKSVLMVVGIYVGMNQTDLINSSLFGVAVNTHRRCDASILLCIFGILTGKGV